MQNVLETYSKNVRLVARQTRQLIQEIISRLKLTQYRNTKAKHLSLGKGANLGELSRVEEVPVGVANATKLIKDGQHIRVHGTEGYIEIMTPAEVLSTSATCKVRSAEVGNGNNL